MTIPLWLFYSMDIVLVLLVGAVSVLIGREHARRKGWPRRDLTMPERFMPPPRNSYDISINFAGKREDHPDFEAQLVKVLEDLRIKETTASPKGDAS